MTTGSAPKNTAPSPTQAASAQTLPDKPASIIAPEGLPIVAGFVIIGAILGYLAALWLGVIGLIVAALIALLCLWCIWFFRDPKRSIPAPVDGRTPVISPADGVICFVGPSTPPEELGLSADQTRGMTRVSVFMNVFNVHVNRAPVAGVVEKTAYRPGKFFNASLDKASEHNERHALLLRMRDGRMLVCVQIAGLIARRIVCRVKQGAKLDAGERYGLIRFGSRVDVYLPAGIEPLVKKGDPSVAGETIFAWAVALPVGVSMGVGAGVGGAAMAGRGA